MSTKRRSGGGSFRDLDELLHRVSGDEVTTERRPAPPDNASADDDRECKAFLLNERLSARSRHHR